ncbi:MAG: pro-sigmaK processing inhibitor BofA family protein [Clostridia bacterium]|nr:pro-sigmaK processing inhibitor BofA family protein [Clostridia bacterium]
MTSAKIFLGFVFSIYVLVIFITHIKSKRFFLSVFLTSLQGLCALFAVNLLGKYISIHIPVNYLTLGISSVSGISGVIMLLLQDIFI